MSTAPTTQCPFCGGTLTIDGDFCPHCGSKKKQFEEHRSSMRAYQKAFDSTKEGVVAENRRKGKTAAAIAVIAFLVMLILAEILLRANSYNLGRVYKAHRAKRHKAEILTEIEYYESTEQYQALYNMWTEHSLRKLEGDPDFDQ